MSLSIFHDMACMDKSTVSVSIGPEQSKGIRSTIPIYTCPVVCVQFQEIRLLTQSMLVRLHCDHLWCPVLKRYLYRNMVEKLEVLIISLVLQYSNFHCTY